MTDQAFKFGDYALIEQKCFGAQNEMYEYKVIGNSRSNVWVDVPVRYDSEEVTHDHLEDVCLCVCSGVNETVVKRYRVQDMKPQGQQQ